MRSFVIAATVVASAAVALADTPNAIVNNNCGYDVYVWSVGDEMSPCNTVGAGKTWSQQFQQRASGGISVKIGKEDNIWGGMPLTQFEYTYLPTGDYNGVFWDMSNINGDPFNDVHTEIVPQVQGNTQSDPDCSTVSCPAGQSKCLDAYNVPDDNNATHSCPLGTSLVFNICGSGSGSSSGSSGSSSSSAPASSAPAYSAPASSAPAYSAPAATSQAPAPTSAAPQTQQAPSPTSAAPVDYAVQTNVAVVTQVVTQVAQAAPSPFSGYVLQWAEGDDVVSEGHPQKREAHENHMERHQRIKRMHHARSAN